MRIFLTIFLGCMILGIAGCGIKPKALDTPSEDVSYPATYPNPATEPSPIEYKGE